MKAGEVRSFPDRWDLKDAWTPVLTVGSYGRCRGAESLLCHPLHWHHPQIWACTDVYTHLLCLQSTYCISSVGRNAVTQASHLGDRIYVDRDVP